MSSLRLQHISNAPFLHTWFRPRTTYHRTRPMRWKTWRRRRAVGRDDPSRRAGNNALLRDIRITMDAACSAYALSSSCLAMGSRPRAEPACFHQATFDLTADRLPFSPGSLGGTTLPCLDSEIRMSMDTSTFELPVGSHFVFSVRLRQEEKHAYLCWRSTGPSDCLSGIHHHLSEDHCKARGLCLKRRLAR